MNCEELRNQWLADPHRLNAEAKLHLLECLHCQEFNHIGLEREATLMTAFKVPADHDIAERILASTAAQRATRPDRAGLMRRWLPMAAAACLAVVVGVQLRNAPVGVDDAGNGHALAVAMVDHLAHEPEALAGGVATPTAEGISGAMQRVGLVWDGAMDAIVYAQVCLLKGATMVHMVVQTDMGPVTVLMTGDAESREIDSAYDGWQLASVDINGSHAILAANNREALTMVEKRLQNQLRLAATALVAVPGAPSV